MRLFRETKKKKGIPQMTLAEAIAWCSEHEADVSWTREGKFHQSEERGHQRYLCQVEVMLVGMTISVSSPDIVESVDAIKRAANAIGIDA